MVVNNRNRSGFTIVELLIVIVVIAILAAITAVTLSNFQMRAYNSKAVTARSGYIKALKMYKQENGRFPWSPGLQTSCLGTVDQYPAKDGFAAGQCFRSDEFSDYVVEVDPYVATRLGAYISSFPSVDWPVTREQVSPGVYEYTRGISYFGAYVSGVPNETQASIWYHLPGNVACGNGVLSSYRATDNFTQCSLTTR